MKTSNQEDFELIINAQKNTTNFDALYQKYADKVYTYLWYRLDYKRELAEDLMQETFVKAFSKIHLYQDKGFTYGTYLLRIAHNILIDYYRTHKPLSLDEIGDIPEEITEHVEKIHEAEQLWKALQLLTPFERDIILMHYQDDMPIKNIASIIKKSENAIKLILSRTRKKLSTAKFLSELAHFKRPALSKKKKLHFKKEPL